MGKFFNQMIPNDNIFVDDDDLWFVNRISNELYSGRLSTGECEYISAIPRDVEDSWRNNPYCIKYDEYIVCIPDVASCIWLYDLKKNKFNRIEIENLQNVRLGCYWYWVVDSTLWIWSKGLGQLIEMDLENKEIKNYYKMSDKLDEQFAYQVTKAGKYIYSFSNERKTLYEFNTETKKMKCYLIMQLDDDIETICCVNNCFWLTGFEDCVYIYDKEENNFNRLTDMPRECIDLRNREYPPFYMSICVNGYICFIPWINSEAFLFVNIKSHQMKALIVESEAVSEKGACFLEYVREDRYIGIFNPNNSYISEIDTETFEITKKRLKLQKKDYTRIMKSRIYSGILSEQYGTDLANFINL